MQKLNLWQVQSLYEEYRRKGRLGWGSTDNASRAPIALLEISNVLTLATHQQQRPTN